MPTIVPAHGWSGETTERPDETTVTAVFRQGITSISAAAFSGCAALTTIAIPEGVMTIGERAFERCTSLVSVTFPTTLKYVGVLAFERCTTLAHITLPCSIVSIGGGAFGGCSSLTCLRIPEGVTSIGAHAFSECTSLAHVTIEGKIEKLESRTFYSCRALTTIAIPASATSIGRKAFQHCSSLTYVGIPPSVTLIEKGAFGWCTALAAIILPGSLTSIGEEAFDGCVSLVCVTLPESVQSIGLRAFVGCTSLTCMLTFSPGPSLLDPGNLPDSIKTQFREVTNPLASVHGCVAVLSNRAIFNATIELGKKFQGTDSCFVDLYSLWDCLVGSREHEHEGDDTKGREALLNLARGRRAFPIVAHLDLLSLAQSVPTIDWDCNLPRQHPRNKHLQEIATLLFEALSKMWYDKTRMEEITNVIECFFIPVAKKHFAECVEHACGMIPEDAVWIAPCHDVQMENLAVQRELQGIQHAVLFSEFARRSDELASKCMALKRPTTQTANTICKLYCQAKLVSKRCDALLAAVSAKTTSTFHLVPHKSLIRACEKLSLAPEPNHWQPQILCDIVRGSIECATFEIMLNVLHQLCELDDDGGYNAIYESDGSSCAASEKVQSRNTTEGFGERISITKSERQFDHTTFFATINFFFTDDSRKHVCEVQLVYMPTE